MDAGCSRKGCEGGRAEQYRMLYIQLIFMCLPNVTTEIPKASAGNRPCIINIIPFCPHVSMPPKWTLYNTQHFPTDRLMALRLQTLCTQSRISRASFFLSSSCVRPRSVRNSYSIAGYIIVRIDVRISLGIFMSGGWGAKVDHVFGKLMDIYTHKRGNSTVFTETGQIAHIPKSLVNPIFYYIYFFGPVYFLPHLSKLAAANFMLSPLRACV